MTQYQLPCECGQFVLIVPTQAGESVVCECGRKLQVPALRAIRQLACVQDSAPSPAPPRWTYAQGLVFACGVLVILLSLLSAGYSHLQRVQFAVTPPSEEIVAGFVGEVDSWSPDEQFKFWNESWDHPFPPGVSPMVVFQREAAAYHRAMLYSFAAMAAGVVLLAVPSLFNRWSRTRP